MRRLKKDLQLSPQAFARMDNLKLLRFQANYYVEKEPNHMVYVPDEGITLLSELRSFHWDFYPSTKSPPIISYMDNLVELRMKNSRLQKLWDGIQVFILFAYVGCMMCY